MVFAGCQARSINSPNPRDNSVRKALCYCHTHFTDEEAEAQSPCDSLKVTRLLMVASEFEVLGQFLVNRV